MNTYGFSFLKMTSDFTKDDTLVINSWKKPVAIMSLLFVIGCSLAFIVLNYKLNITAGDDIFIIFIIGLFVSLIANGAVMYKKIHKIRLSYDSYGITVHIGKKEYKVLWQDVTYIKVTEPEKTDIIKSAEYYNITHAGKEEHPFKGLLVEKTGETEEELLRYYKGAGEIY